jgi:hypothetical protein
MQCKTCQYFQGTEKHYHYPDPIGDYVRIEPECKRYPTPVSVNPSDWCGEYRFASDKLHAKDWLEGHDQTCELRRNGAVCTCYRKADTSG